MTEIEKKKVEKKKKTQTKTGTVGDLITMNDGTKYEIQSNGAWKRI